MSKVSLRLLEQRASAVESCVSSLEFSGRYQDDEIEYLRDNWDLLYTMILDMHENIQDFLGEIEE